MRSSQILVAEDESIVALDIQKALQGCQYEIVNVVSSGEEAVQRAADTHPDLVLMDIRLAGKMDGIEAASRIRQEFDIPVIYLTAFADEDTLTKAKVAAPFGYIVKPFRSEDLRTSIEVAIYQHQIEKKLRSQEEWLSTILRSTGDAVVVTDPKGSVTYINPVGENLLGWRLKEAHGKNWRDGFNIIDAASSGDGPVAQAIREAAQVSLSGPAQLILKSNNQISISGSVAALRGETGQVVGTVMVFRDVTELQKLQDRLRLANEGLEKRVQERTAQLAELNEDLSKEIMERRQLEGRLRESEMRFRSLAESANDGILLTDSNGFILYGNRSAQTLFAAFEEEFIGKSLREFIGPEDRNALDGLMEKLSSGSKPVEVTPITELSGLSRMGRAFPMELSLASWQAGPNRYFAGTFRDITDRRRMEDRLRRSASEIADLYDNAPCGYHSVDRTGIFVQINETQLSWTGFDREAIIGKKKLIDFVADEDRESFQEGFSLLLERGWVKNLEFRMLRKDGSDFPVLMSATAVKDENGEFVMSRATVYDVTERKRAEESMRESESKFRSIAESAHDAIILADRGGRVIYENKSARILFAYTESGIVGKQLRDLVAERHRSELDDLLRKTAGRDAKALGRILEWDGLDRHGREFPMEMSLAAWTADRVRFVAGIIRDVTERRRAEGNLKFQADILAQVKDSVIVTNSGGQIIYYSPAAEKLYGRKMSEAIGQDMQRFIGPIVRPEEEKLLIDTLNSVGVWRGEAVHKRGDERELHVELSLSQLKNHGGQVVGRLHIVRDVTDQKKMHEMLLHAEKLAAMGQMAAAVAHELKTPLSVIFGFADVMLKKLKEEHKAEHPMDVIKRQAMRCSNLITNLLEFSRKEKTLVREIFELNQPVESALSLIQAHAQTRSITVEKKLASSSLKLLCNKDLVQQVVINLCLNAIDAMSQGGLLTVNTRSRRVNRSSFAQIEISDTGPGIIPEIRKKIFEPFFTTKKPTKGTGLGLWLVREIVSALGGEIQCESEVGKGSVFTVLLPLTDAEEASEPSVEPELDGMDGHHDGKNPKRRVVVVDDEKDFLDLMRQWLSPRYKVECFSSGTELLQQKSEDTPDLIILDVRMPGIDGFETCRQIRADGKRGRAPILFLTASKNDVGPLRTLDLGANAYLYKPVTKQALFRRIEELLSALPAPEAAKQKA